MTSLIDKLSQTRVAIADCRVLYRQSQAMKRDQMVGQEYVNSVSDDLDNLIRYFAELRLRAEALIEHVEFPDIEEDKAVEMTIVRLYERMESNREVA